MPGLKFPKKSGRKTRREAAHDRYKAERPGVREQAYALDGGRCVFPTCGQAVALKTDSPFVLAHIHETTFRSALGDPTDIDIAVTTCWQCHAHCHVRVGGKLKRIEGNRTDGLRFYARRTGNDQWEEVTR